MGRNATVQNGNKEGKGVEERSMVERVKGTMRKENMARRRMRENMLLSKKRRRSRERSQRILPWKREKLEMNG